MSTAEDSRKTDSPASEVPSPAVKAADSAAEAAANKASLAAGAGVNANNLGEYIRATFSRIRSGESGVLPVVGGLLVISILFQSLNDKFLTAGNLVNLLVQGAAYMIFAMGVIFLLLLGEIDLSIGFVGGVGGVVTVELLKSSNGWPWAAAVIAGLVATAAIGALQGTIITRIGLPSFVVTLAGQLGWQALMLFVLGSGGSLAINSNIINDIASGSLTPLASWIVFLVVAGSFGAMTWLRDSRRRKSGLVAPPASVSMVKIAGVFAAGVAIVLVCNTNRGNGFVRINGLPWVLLLVLAVLAFNTALLNRTRFGRYLYAIGGNAEAARRGGINVPWMRTAAFALASLMAGVAGIVYASRLRSVSTNFDGGTLVLYAIAAAVIGGTSLFGGRGKALHGVLGGLVIAAIYNGMGLQGYSAPAQYAVTALVLLAAVTIDALAHRGSLMRR
jgi:D-xylose transport system permease protein